VSRNSTQSKPAPVFYVCVTLRTRAGIRVRASVTRNALFKQSRNVATVLARHTYYVGTKHARHLSFTRIELQVIRNISRSLYLAFGAIQIARERQSGAAKCFCRPGISVTLRGLCVVSVSMIRHSNHDLEPGICCRTIPGELLPPLMNGSMAEICTALSVESWLFVPVHQASSLLDALFGDYPRKTDDRLDYPSNAS
jgi:hypothetical protein